MNKKMFYTYLFAVLSMVFWGMSFVWFKIANLYLQPISIIFIRLCISSVMLFSFMLLIRKFERIKRVDLKYFILLAFFQPFCYFLGESYGLTMVSSTLASIIISTIPVFAPVFAFIIYRERLSALNIAGVVLSFAGVVVMILKKDFSFDASLWGLLLLFFAVVAAIAYSLVMKKIAISYNPVNVIAWQNLFGAAMFLPFFLIVDYNSIQTATVNGELIYSLLLLAFFASSMAYILYTIVIRNIGVARANIFAFSIPVFTLIFAYFFIDEEITMRKLVGMAVVIGGLVLSQLGKKTLTEKR